MLGNVLSLFDGISGGQVALDRLGIKYKNYYASEIDKYAIQITQKNYPKTIQIGDVTKVKASDLPKIDLLMGGSPCQGFSIANQNRKNLVFNEYGVCSDERSQLFFEFVRLLKETKPKWWFLENVRMKKEHMEIVNKVLSDAVGYEVKPYLVNSSVRSGQNRLRYYWTNIPFENNLEDWGIKLKDILEPIPFSKDYPNYLRLPIVRKKTGVSKKTRGEMVRSIDDEKSLTVNATMWKKQTSSYVKAQEINPFRPCEPREIKKDSLCHHVADATDIKGNQAIKRVYGGEGKSPTLTTMGGGHREPKVLVPPKEHTVIDNNWYYRKLTPTECERLQTFDDGYTSGLSNTRRFQCLGNSWTVAVIMEFFKNIN